MKNERMNEANERMNTNEANERSERINAIVFTGLMCLVLLSVAVLSIIGTCPIWLERTIAGIAIASYYFGIRCFILIFRNERNNTNE